MTTRLRLLQGATALLYFGPLLAGLVGHGWAMVLPFVAIFTLWSILLRPHLWPGPGQFRRPEALVALASLLATQALLVVLCFGLGRGFGGVMGLDLALPFWFPAALSFLAVPLSRLAWQPVTGFDPLTHRPGPLRDPGPLLTALSRLPDTAPEADVQACLIAAELAPEALRKALADPRGPVFARARILLATDPDLADAFAGSRYAASLFPPAPEDLGLYTARALRLVERDPGAAADLPSPAALRTAAAAAPDQAAALIRLAERLEAAHA